MDRAKAIFKNILAILLGLTLALVALEIMLRMVAPVEYRVRGNKIFLPRHKKYIFTNKTIDRLDKVICYSRNQLGFRGEPPPRNFAETLSILTVGGSTTECVLISDGKTWSDILASRLKQKFKPLWLNNAGPSSWPKLSMSTWPRSWRKNFLTMPSRITGTETR